VPSQQDINFVQTAAQSGLAEINEGTLALQKAPDIAVREFGRWMQSDHGLLNQILGLAGPFLGISVPTTPDAEHQAALNQLSALPPDEFQTAYINGQVADHQAAVNLFQTEAQSGQESLLVLLAQTALPVLQAHLTQSQELQAFLQSGGSLMPGQPPTEIPAVTTSAPVI